MSLKRVEKKTLLGRHKKDISWKICSLKICNIRRKTLVPLFDWEIFKSTFFEEQLRTNPDLNTLTLFKNLVKVRKGTSKTTLGKKFGKRVASWFVKWLKT